jgi:undecaprenyl-phosphate galactose phosphotransferase
MNRYYFILIALTLLVFITQSLYFSRIGFYNEYKKMIKSALMLIIFWGFLIFVFKLEAIYSRFLSLVFFSLLILIYPFYRKLVKTLLYHLNIWSKDVLVMGDHFPATLKKLLNDRVLGYRARYHQVKDSRDLMARLAQEPPGKVAADLILVSDQIEIEKWEPALKRIEFDFETIRIFSGFSKILNYIFFMETNLPANMFIIKRNLLKPYNRFLKRVFDLFGATLILLMLTPLLALITVVLLVTNRGKVFFIQERMGFMAKSFKLIKFKTMFDHSDQILENYLKSQPDKRQEWKRFRKLSGYDPRVTRMGRLLRKLSLDELPQLFNIVKGDMSLVGPRPYLKQEISDLDYHEHILFYAKPGLTGLWQVLGRNDIDVENRFIIDEYYIRNWDFWMDLYVLMRTPSSMPRGN